MEVGNGERKISYKRRRKINKSEVSSSYVSSTSSCRKTDRSGSIRSIYPPPSSIKSDDLPSQYESKSDTAAEFSDINDGTSIDVLSREFSNMNIKIDDNNSLSSSENSSELEIATHIYTSSNRRASQHSLFKAKSRHTIFEHVESEKPKLKDIKSKLVDSELEILQLLETCIRLPITNRELNRISFSENLMISYNKTKNNPQNFGLKLDENQINCPKIRNLMPSQSDLVGAYCVKVTSYDNSNIMIFCSSQQSLNGSGGSSKIMSTVDLNFKLFEEKKTECQMFPDKKVEKILHIVQHNDKFIAFRTELNEKDEGVQHRTEVGLPSGDMLLNGGSFALMRYLVIKQFTGQLKFWTTDIEGNVFKSIYDIGKTRVININNIPYKTYRIKKTLLRRDGLKNDISKSYYLPSGFLVRHEWKDCPYFLHLNPLSKIPPKIYPSLEEDWMNDVILVSKYLDEKDKHISETKTYMGDHPEIKSMLQDYLLCMLYIQPEHILDYTIKYFLNLFKDY